MELKLYIIVEFLITGTMCYVTCICYMPLVYNCVYTFTHLHHYIPTKADMDYFKGLLFFYFVSFTHRSTIGKTSGHWLLGQRVGNIE